MKVFEPGDILRYNGTKCFGIAINFIADQVEYIEFKDSAILNQIITIEKECVTMDQALPSLKLLGVQKVAPSYLFTWYDYTRFQSVENVFQMHYSIEMRSNPDVCGFIIELKEDRALVRTLDGFKKEFEFKDIWRIPRKAGNAYESLKPPFTNDDPYYTIDIIRCHNPN